jgi:uncharacterized membrane protein
MRLPHRLGRELDAWQRDGLISDDQRRAILSRYEPAASASQQASTILVTLAILAAGTGVVVFLAWNWNAIPPLVKLGNAILAVAASYAASAVKARAGKHVHAERLAFFGALLSGGALFVGAEMVHADPERTGILMLWAIVLASTAWLTPSALSALAGTVVLVWWMLVTAGSPPAPWAFLLIWPMLAAAVERAENRLAAGGVAIAFGIGAFFFTFAVWGDRVGAMPVAAFAVALLAGAWLDALAHTDAPRRPAFARATPALFVVLLSLVWLLPSGFHREMGDWRDASASAWPVLALAGALAVMTVRLSVTRAGWRWRSLTLVVISIAWLLAWFVTPAAYRASGIARWTWTVIFSAAMVWVGSLAVREASTTGDRGVLGLGVVAIVAVVVIRAADAQGGLLVQAALLLALAALLAWLARSWSRGQKAAPS